jgi:hypothetical protein
MNWRLIIAVGLLALVSACSAGPNSRTPSYYNDNYNNDNYHNGNYHSGNNGAYRPYYNIGSFD